MAEAIVPLSGKVVTKPFLVLTALALVGLILIAWRYLFGLGAVTNLSDGYPWGLWITYDVLIGTALGCGGYAMAFLVYIFNRWEYHPLVRSAVLTSVFGYTLAGPGHLPGHRALLERLQALPALANQFHLRPGGSGPLHRSIRGGALARASRRRSWKAFPSPPGPGRPAAPGIAGCRSSWPWASCCPPCTSPPWGR